MQPRRTKITNPIIALLCLLPITCSCSQTSQNLPGPEHEIIHQSALTLAKTKRFENIEATVIETDYRPHPDRDNCHLLIRFDNHLWTSTTAHYGTPCTEELKSFINAIEPGKTVILTRITERPNLCIDGLDEQQLTYWIASPKGSDLNHRLALGFGSNKSCGGTIMGYKDAENYSRETEPLIVERIKERHSAYNLYISCIDKTPPNKTIESYRLTCQHEHQQLLETINMQ